MILPLLLFLLAPQDTPAPGSPPPDDRPVTLYPVGGVEAPAQPSRASRSAVRRAPRVAPATGRGTDGRVLVRVGDMVVVRGQEENVVQGIGLVTGLSGTGDGGNAARLAILNMLKTQNLNLSLQDVSSANVAMVLVQASLEPGIKPGRAIDVRVSSINDCESLVGGVLLQTQLTTMDGQTVYATATGPVTTGAFSAEGEGASAVRNHLTVGTIPLGGKVERPVPAPLLSDHGFLYLDMRAMKGSFANATRVADVINEIYPAAAVPQDAMTVAVRIPDDLPESEVVPYLSSILARELEPVPFARVVINERTGVIVMGEGVRITRGAITKGNLTVTVAETPEASQPGPLSEGTTEVLPRTNVLVEEEDRALTIVNGAVSLQEVVEVLNVLGVSPRDMIQILQSMAQQGMLHAEILVM
ncbi:MAG: flagellar basal body P-ring protein FlgI [Planctomycetota bacterium]